MLGLEKVFKLWKDQRNSLPPTFEIEGILEKKRWLKEIDRFYNLPLTLDEQFIVSNSSVVESDIQDLQFRLKRKLSYSELKILKLTSDNGIMIRDGDFQP